MNLRCLLFGHKKVYWTEERLYADNALGGVFTPWYCERCNHHSDVFHYPKHDNRDLIKSLKEATNVVNGWHVSHKPRHSDSSRYDQKCVNCGLTDIDEDILNPCIGLDRLGNYD